MAHYVILSTERSTHQSLKDRVFSDLWEQGYYITSGLKYGGDFLVYADDPSRSHSTYLAVVTAYQEPVHSLATLARVANKVKKRVLLCSPDENQVHYCTLEWAGIA